MGAERRRSVAGRSAHWTSAQNSAIHRHIGVRRNMSGAVASLSTPRGDRRHRPGRGIRASAIGSSGNAGDLAVGDCFDAPTLEGQTVSDVQHHPCTEAHTGEVFAVVTQSRGSTRRTRSSRHGSPSSGDACAAPFLRYVGIAMDSSTLLDIRSSARPRTAGARAIGRSPAMSTRDPAVTMRRIKAVEAVACRPAPRRSRRGVSCSWSSRPNRAARSTSGTASSQRRRSASPSGRRTRTSATAGAR